MSSTKPEFEPDDAVSDELSIDYLALARSLSHIESMKRAIFNVTASVTGATFSKLQRHIPHFIGDEAFILLDVNIILWDRITPLARAAIMDALDAGELVAERVSRIIYGIDGKFNRAMQCPQASRDVASRNEYLAWLPVAFWTPRQCADRIAGNGQNRHGRRANKKSLPSWAREDMIVGSGASSGSADEFGETLWQGKRLLDFTALREVLASELYDVMAAE